MTRVIMGALLTAAFFVLLHRPANAMFEFCPATLKYGQVNASLYGFELTALGSRTISSATLAFDTSAGWYTVDVSMLNIVEKDRHYTGPSGSFVRRDYVSPIMYARFPKPLTVSHAWVFSATATSDGDFGWDKQGDVRCDPLGEPRVIGVMRIKDGPSALGHDLYHLDGKDKDALSNQPSEKSIVLVAQHAKIPLEDPSCLNAFDYALVLHTPTPDFPDGLRGYSGTATVQVALDGSGKLIDAWIWGPSGFPAFDAEAMRLARGTTYSAGSAYCKAAPGNYLFRVSFDA